MPDPRIQTIREALPERWGTMPYASAILFYDALDSLAADLEAARAAMPSTFYAGQPLAERIRKMSDLWNRAIVANEAAEADLEAAREALMDLLASDHSTARAKARAALARLSAGKEGT